MNDNSVNQVEQSDDDRLDRAMAQRLAKLGRLPVDISGLERRLRTEIGPGDIASAEPSRRMRIGSFSRYRAVAAAILVGAVIAAVVLISFIGPAYASSSQMAQVHEDIVSGRTPVIQVNSIEEASHTLSKDWSHSPGLPNVPNDHVMACCMKSVRNKKMACVLLKAEGVPITMAVANAADMRLPSSPSRTRGGITYHLQSTGRLNMVMTEHDGRWVCLIAELPADRLMDFADQLQF